MSGQSQYYLDQVSLEASSASLEALPYEQYFRQRGIRRITQLERPTILDLPYAELPKYSIYHYNPESDKLYGPLESNPWVKSMGNLRFIKHQTQYAFEPQGMVTKKASNFTTMIQLYRQKHRTLRLLQDLFQVEKSPNINIVYNYCLIEKLWRYRDHKMTQYYRFMNLYQTILINMDKLASQSDRQQFFEIRLPTQVLSRGDYRMYNREIVNGVTNRLLNTFKDNDSWLLFHLWLWLGQTPELSIFSKINPRHYKKINLVLTESGKYVMLNLGLLAEWKGQDIDEGEDLEEDEVSQSGSSQIQTKFHRLLMALLSYRTAPPKELVDVPVYTEQDIKEAEKSLSLNRGNQNGSLPSEQQEEVLENPDEVLVETTIQKPVIHEEKPGLLQQAKDILFDEPEAENTLSSNFSSDIDDPSKQELTLRLQNDLREEEAEEKQLEEETFGLAPEIVADLKHRLVSGDISSREYEKSLEMMQRYKTLPSPYDPEKTIEEAISIPEEEIFHFKKRQAPDNPWVLDKSMLTSSAEEMDKQYIQKILPRNIIQAVMKLQHAGVIVKGMERKVVRDPVTHYELLKVKVQPIGGVESTLEIKLPVPDEEGAILINGTKSFIRKTRMDKPIRKTAPTKVKLTSAYGKIFIEKSTKQGFNVGQFWLKKLQLLIMDEIIKEVVYEKSFDPTLKIHPYYGMLASRFNRFQYTSIIGDKWQFCFNYHQRGQLLTQDEKEAAKLLLDKEIGDRVLIAVSREGKELFFNKVNGVLEDNENNIHTISSFFGFDEPKGEMAETTIMGKSVPIILVLGYHLGLSNLCKRLKVKPKKYFPKQRIPATPHDYVLKFADETWVFDRRDYHAHLIINGLNQFRRYLGDYSVTQFDDPDVYIALLRDAGLPIGIEAEIKRQPKLFIDNITASILKQMGEPTEFIGLIIRAVELLTNSWSRPEINMDDMMIVGYQRIANHVYKQLCQALKEAEKGGVKARQRFNIQPTRIFQAIMNDSVTTLINDINPIENLKEHDNVTFGGEGGRSRRSMVAHTRAYDVSDLGTVSEATVDNQDVGITTFLSGSPNITSLYGETKRIEDDLSKEGTASIFSSSALLGVGADTDDPKRVLFLTVQNSHTIPIQGAVPMPVRTGYDHMVAHRVGKKFVTIAEQAGEVVELSDKHIAIRYQDGSEKRAQLGKMMGVSTGKIVDNTLITDYRLGQQVNPGDVVAYNPYFFTRDVLVPGQVLFKNAALALTTFMESNDTEEDSTAISPRLGQVMETNTIKQRTIFVPFENEIRNLVLVGDKVKEDTPVCTLVDAVFSNNNMYDEDTLASLMQLAQATPRAKYAGQVVKIEILYKGKPTEENTSSSIRQLIRRYDNERKKLAEQVQDGRAITNEVLDNINVDGQALLDNHVAIKIFIESQDGQSVGDKVVFSLQLKSIVGRVLNGRNETESGKPIDAIFGYQSVSNRIVQSAELMGTANILLKLISKEVIDIYRDKFPK